MLNIYNDDKKIDDKQVLYDSYNFFMMSDDRKLFFKLYWRIKFFEMVKHLHGDIVECGVFKGSGLLLWLKLLDYKQSNSLKKVIGFDFFGQDFVKTLKDDIDKEMMGQVFSRDSELKNDDISIKGIKNKIKQAGFSDDRYQLVQGDISKTSFQFLENRPGFRISLLYLDLDLEKPTYDTLTALWDRVVPGGVVVFDEYAYHSWSEANAVDKFIDEKGLCLENTDIETPTAFIIK